MNDARRSAPPRQRTVSPAVSVGSHAAERLAGSDAHGRVVAVFARGVHVRFDGGLILSVGRTSLGEGPSNLLIGDAEGDAFARLAPGDEARVRGASLHLGGLRIDTSRAPRYRTPPAPPLPAEATLRRARARLSALADRCADGFAWRLANALPSVASPTSPSVSSAIDRRRALYETTASALTALEGWLADQLAERPNVASVERARDDRPSPVARALRDRPSSTRCARHDRPSSAEGARCDRASSAARARRDHASSVERGDRAFVEREGRAAVDPRLDDPIAPPRFPPREVLALVGAGPGLTPAGDDLLAGALLALRRLHAPTLAAALWRRLSPALATRTHPFSAAQLALAADGECAATVQRLLDALFECPGTGSASTTDERTRSLGERLDAIGASSGHDLAAGIALVLDARLARGADPARSEAQVRSGAWRPRRGIDRGYA